MAKGKGKGKGKGGHRNKRNREGQRCSRNEEDRNNPAKRQKTGDYSDKIFCFPGTDPTSLKIEGSEAGGAFTLLPQAEGANPVVGKWTRADIDPEVEPSQQPQPKERMALTMPQFPGLKLTFSRNLEVLKLATVELQMDGQTLTFPAMLKPEATKTEREGGASDSDDEQLPRRLVALMFGYVGSGYQGLQINPGCNSVELHLERALVKSGCIKECNSMAENATLIKSKWTRCGRTDKGVHAAAQVVGAKLHMIDNLIDTVNKHLPADIKVIGCTRVTQSFNAKLHCSGRSYVYMLPARALETSGQPIDISKMNKILSCFHGTHNFHNYTKLSKAGIESAESQANNRYLTSVTCGQSKLVNGVEFLPLKLDGQSFLFNQIRHMVAMSVFVYRAGCNCVTAINKSFELARMPLPLAPGEFLFLDKCHYFEYKSKVARQEYGEVNSMDFTSVEGDRQQFLNSVIFPYLATIENAADGVLQPWLNSCHGNVASFETLFSLLQTSGGTCPVTQSSKQCGGQAATAPEQGAASAEQAVAAPVAAPEQGATAPEQAVAAPVAAPEQGATASEQAVAATSLN